jgi:hypothetical protein
VGGGAPAPALELRFVQLYPLEPTAVAALPVVATKMAMVVVELEALAVAYAAPRTER